MIKIRRNGLVTLVVFGVVALLVAIFGPILLDGFGNIVAGKDQSVRTWELAAKGIVESTSEVNISSQVTGVVKQIMINEGDLVRVGDPLIQVDNTKVRARVELSKAELMRAEARLEQLESGYREEDIEAAKRAFDSKQSLYNLAANELARMEQLHKIGAATEVEWEKAKIERDVALAEMLEAEANFDKFKKGPRKEEIAMAKADRDSALAEINFHQAALADYTVLSPIQGTVITKSAEIGETVDIGTPLFYIVDTDNLRVWAEVEESDAGKIQEGQNVSIETDAFPDKKFSGKVAQVFQAVERKRQRAFDPVASFDVNTQKIYIDLDDSTELIHGLTVTVRFK